MTGFRRRGSRVVLLLATLPTCWLGCGRQEGEHPRIPRDTPIVLISIDTLRADRLPAYGYDRVATPAIDALRRDSILYLRAYSHVPFTLPSHVSILTGLLPTQHQVRDNVGYPLEAAKVPYLPRILKELGYATGAMVSSYVLNGGTGLASDWDLYDDRVPVIASRDLGGLQRPGAETLEAALAWLDTVGERPFFLFFHIYEPHTPYDAPQAIASRYESPYDADVAVADGVVGRLIDDLKRRGLYTRSLVILLSDHGEGLMDHGDPEHNLFLYREVLEVPLMIKLPGAERAGATVEAPAELRDVFPTLTELLGLERPQEVGGMSLLAIAEPDAPNRRIYAENYYPRLHFRWSELASIIEWPFHLIWGPDPELYHLAEDPTETRNLLREERRVFGALKQELDGYDRTLSRQQEADPETRERLAALGYLGGGGGGDDLTGPLPDPKSKLGVFQQLRTAFKVFGENDFERAVVEFRQLTEQEPGMTYAWQYLARSLRRLGRNEEALAAFQEAMELSAGAPEIARGAADLLLEMGRLEEARAHALIALPTFQLANEVLAEVALRQEELAEAETYSAAAVEHRGSHLSPLITRARVLVELGRLDEALAVTDEAEEEFGDRRDFETLRGLFLARGKAYAEMGEAGKAIAAFRREIELSPASLAPYTHLALVYGLIGQGPQVGSTLREMVETNPSAHAYAEAVRTLRLIGDERSAELLLRSARRRWPEDAELRELAS